MGLRRGIGIGAPNLNGLIRLAHDQPQTRLIKGGAHDASLRI